MAVPQPTSDAFNDRYDSRTLGRTATQPSRVKVERSTQRPSARRAWEVAKTAADVATLLDDTDRGQAVVRRNHKAGARIKDVLERELDAYDQGFEDIDSLEDVAQALKKQGVLRTSVHALLEIWAKIKASRALSIIAIFALGACIFQTILAVVNMFSAGIAYAISESGQALTYSAVATAGGTVGAIAVAADITLDGALSKGATELAGAAGQAIQEATGVSVGDFFNIYSPQFWFEISTFMVWSLGIALMFVTALIFFFVGIKPLWGRHMSTKIAFFSLGMVGYAFPVLNLVPWFLVYAVVIWLYPR